MNDNIFAKANNMFKWMRDNGLISDNISRRVATRALISVMELKCSGDIQCPSTSYPNIPGLLDTKLHYNLEYLDRVFGLLRRFADNK